MTSLLYPRRAFPAAFLALMAFAAVGLAAEPMIVPLWTGDAPGSAGKTGEEQVRITEGGDHVVSNVHHPSLTVYPPQSNATGAAVILAPGGGHRELWTTHEGHNEAKWLASTASPGSC